MHALWPSQPVYFIFKNVFILYLLFWVSTWWLLWELVGSCSPIQLWFFFFKEIVTFMKALQSWAHWILQNCWLSSFRGYCSGLPNGVCKYFQVEPISMRLFMVQAQGRLGRGPDHPMDLTLPSTGHPIDQSLAPSPMSGSWNICNILILGDCQLQHGNFIQHKPAHIYVNEQTAKILVNGQVCTQTWSAHGALEAGNVTSFGEYLKGRTAVKISTFHSESCS